MTHQAINSGEKWSCTLSIRLILARAEKWVILNITEGFDDYDEI